MTSAKELNIKKIISMTRHEYSVLMDDMSMTSADSLRLLVCNFVTHFLLISECKHGFRS
jgi:hypothetical protein